MKAGLISDTHSNMKATRQAAAIFLNEGVEVLFHCGDIGSFEILAELATTGIPVHAVLGNVDTYASDFKFFPTNVGVRLYGRFGEIEMDGRRIALLHSDDKLRYLKTISSGSYDFVFSGHSHVEHDFVKSGTRCINPGTAGRGNPGTCAVLDLDSGTFELFRLQ